MYSKAFPAEEAALDYYLQTSVSPQTMQYSFKSQNGDAVNKKRKNDKKITSDTFCNLYYSDDLIINKTNRYRDV